MEDLSDWIESCIYTVNKHSRSTVSFGETVGNETRVVDSQPMLARILW